MLVIITLLSVATFCKSYVSDHRLCTACATVTCVCACRVVRVAGVMGSPAIRFEELTKLVNEYMEMPPFNFTNILKQYGGHVKVRYYVSQCD